MNPQLVTVEDKTNGLLTPQQFSDLCWALNYQALYHYGRSPWVERGYSPPAYVQGLAAGVSAPVNAWNIELLDVSDVEGALGYHEDQAFGSSQHSVRTLSAHGTPISKVFVKTSREDGVDPVEVASHEMLEMLVDPYVASNAEVRKVLNHTKREWYIVEVGDPVQNCGYKLGDPNIRQVTVSDFAWPAWFGLPQSRPNLSQQNSVSQPFELAPGGYMSVAPEAQPENWTQIYGSAHAAGGPATAPAADPDAPKAAATA